MRAGGAGPRALHVAAVRGERTRVGRAGVGVAGRELPVVRAADVANTAQGITRGAGWASFSLVLALSNRGLLGIGFRARQYGLRVCADVP